MNPSTAQASVVVDELVRNGVRHVVLCPGSRNAPLSLALHAAAVAGRLTLHVRIDERSAGFFAVGLARGLAYHPPRAGFVAVVCTSGTAVANLHPAVLEAYYGRVALLLVTADRPGELVGTGANQTVGQHGVFGPEVSTMDFPVAERIPGRNPVWRGLVCRAVAAADADRPVHLNVPFREPLVPTAADPWPDSLLGRPDDQPWTRRPPHPVHPADAPAVRLPPHTLVVLGDCSFAKARQSAAAAASRGWPVLAEPTAAPGAAAGGRVVRHGALLLAAGAADRLPPDAVVVVGRPTLSRGVQRLLAGAPAVHLVDDGPQWTDGQHVAASVSVSLPTGAPIEPGWLADWRHAERAAVEAVDAVLGDAKWPTGLRVARDLVDALPPGAVLFAGSSNPVRDLDLVAAARPDLLVFANRGTAGIDGGVSSAAGAAMGAPGGPGYALLGDLTFLYDSGGLLIGPGEPRPDLTVVVVNDDGGGVFSLLEQGEPAHASAFERVFGTPHGVDLGALCAAHSVPHLLAGDADEFRAALAPAPGLRVVEVRADRGALRDLHARLRAEVRTRLS